MTTEQALELLDILANAFASTVPLTERSDLTEALSNLNRKVYESSLNSTEDV